MQPLQDFVRNLALFGRRTREVGEDRSAAELPCALSFRSRRGIDIRLHFGLEGITSSSSILASGDASAWSTASFAVVSAQDPLHPILFLFLDSGRTRRFCIQRGYGPL